MPNCLTTNYRDDKIVVSEGGEKVKRLRDLPHYEAEKIRRRQLAGTMMALTDEDGYKCYDEREYESWKPRTAGRKPRKKGE